MKQVVAALAVFAALLVLVVVLMRDGDDEAATAPKDAETVATVGEEGGGADVADEPVRDASGDDGMAGDAAGMTVGESAGTDDADDAAVPPGFDIVRVEPSGEAVMAGVAEPGAEVSVMTRDGVVAQTGADDRGEWVVVLEEPLEPGDHEIWLEAGNGNGEIVESAGAVVISIPRKARTSMTTRSKRSRSMEPGTKRRPTLWKPPKRAAMRGTRRWVRPSPGWRIRLAPGRRIQPVPRPRRRARPSSRSPNRRRTPGRSRSSFRATAGTAWW